MTPDRTTKFDGFKLQISIDKMINKRPDERGHALDIHRIKSIDKHSILTNVDVIKIVFSIIFCEHYSSQTKNHV